MMQPAKLMVATPEAVGHIARAELSRSTVLVSLSSTPYRHHAIGRVARPELSGGIVLASLSSMPHPNLPGEKGWERCAGSSSRRRASNAGVQIRCVQHVDFQWRYLVPWLIPSSRAASCRENERDPLFK
jgi:hypothetical protein